MQDIYNYAAAYLRAEEEIECLRKALRKAAEDLDMDAGPPAFGAEAIVAHYLEQAERGSSSNIAATSEG